MSEAPLQFRLEDEESAEALRQTVIKLEDIVVRLVTTDRRRT